MESQMQFTDHFDSEGVPIAVNDLVRIKHFVAARRRQVWMYRKVLIINGKHYLLAVEELGLKPTAECFKTRLDGFSDRCEIISGDSFNHPLTGWLVCWWERKSVWSTLPEEFKRAGHGLHHLSRS